MIVSHKHRFIFLKTAKTAGSSIEQALKRLCGPEDILTDTGLATLSDGRQVRSQNDRRGLGKLGVYVPGSLARRLPQIAGFHPHMRARHVRAMIGRETWNHYFKISVERNPWDRQVSLFFYRHRRKSRGLDFERYLTSPLYSRLHSTRLDNWEIYTIDGRVAVDRVLRFEHLEEDFAALCREIGLPETELPHANRGRARDGADYRDFYTTRTRDVVARWYRNEIETFGYEF